MFSTRFPTAVGWVTNIGLFFGVSTLSFDPSTLRFVTKDGKWAKVRVNLNCSFMLMWLLSSLVKVVVLYSTGDINLFNKTLAFWLLLVTVSIPYFMQHYHAISICQSMNGLFNLCLHFRREYLPDFEPNTSLANVVADFYAFSLIGAMGTGYLVALGTLLVSPRVGTLIGGMVPLHLFTLPVRIITSLLQTYVHVLLFVGMMGYSLTQMAYLFYSVMIVYRQMQFSRQLVAARTSTANQTHLRPKNIRRLYRCLQVLHANYVCFAGPCYVLLNALVMKTVLFCIFVTIRFSAQMSSLRVFSLIICSLVVTFAWLFVLQMGSLFIIFTGKTLADWKRVEWAHSNEKKGMSRFRRSCQPIVLGFEKTYTIRPKTVLIFLRGVIKGTFRALLATQ